MLQTGGQLKDIIKDMQQPEYQQSKAEEHFRICGQQISEIFQFFKMRQNEKLLRESYEDYFIDLNQNQKFLLELAS